MGTARRKGVTKQIPLPNNLTGELAHGKIWITDQEGDYVHFKIEEGDAMLAGLRDLLKSAGEDGEPLPRGAQ